MIEKMLTTKELHRLKGLWHGINIDNTKKILDSGVMKARTMHRYWKDGLFFLDDQREEYEKSFYMKGWSVTRDRSYACNWNDIVFLLDEEMIKRDFKVKPIAWNATIRGAYNFKKEREEFIVAERVKKTFDEIKSEYVSKIDQLDERYDNAIDLGDDVELNLVNKETDFFNKEVCNNEGLIGFWRSPSKNTIDIKKYIIGFILSDSKCLDRETSFLEDVKNNPLFLGFYSAKKARRDVETSRPEWNRASKQLRK